MPSATPKVRIEITETILRVIEFSEEELANYCQDAERYDPVVEALVCSKTDVKGAFQKLSKKTQKIKLNMTGVAWGNKEGIDGNEHHIDNVIRSLKK